jgi:MT0933-like antitoxin protein
VAAAHGGRLNGVTDGKDPRMGFMDKLKGLFGGHKQQIDQGIDKAADTVKEKVPDEHVGKVDAVADKAHEAVEKLTDTTPADSAPPDSAPAAPAAPVDSAPIAPAASPAAPADSAPAAPAAPADPEPAP